jgi:hypothetical protein
MFAAQIQRMRSLYDSLGKKARLIDSRDARAGKS